MKQRISLVLALALAFCLAAGCAGAPDTTPASHPPVETGLDLSASPFKHITNGGLTDHEELPYNIDAITGATQTVEGPGVVTSIPLSVREIENAKQGIVRGTYTDSRGTYLYEGLDLYTMLHEMREGDNGIILTDTAHVVCLKDANRVTIATLTLQEIRQCHDAGRPVLIAYGIGTPDGKEYAPFVFDGESEEVHSLGYREDLKNDDGCLKLVYDFSLCGQDNDYATFSNVAYLYVQEATEPGFKHTAAQDSVYADPKYTDYPIIFRGDALGREFVMSVAQLEALAAYDENNQLISGGIGYADEYSLANNAYWYVNRYEGLELYKLLQYLGMPSAEDMGLAAARTTMVNFIADDGVASTETFSIDTLSYPDVFGYYKKNATDPGDGTYVSEPSDLVRSGYPVLLAYGVNNYPYTISKNDNGYLSGLSNSGGPMRVVFGKTMYNHANGSRQVQYIREILVGKDKLYNTHFGTDNADHSALVEQTVLVQVCDESGNVLSEQAVSVAQVEQMIYGENVTGAQKKAAQVRNRYPLPEESAYFEGVNLEYFLMEQLGIPGTTGSITFQGQTGDITVSLGQILEESRKAGDPLRSILAFSRNGTPLVPTTDSPGYEKEVALHPYLDSDPSAYAVDNAGGPVMVLLPEMGENGATAVVENLTAIRITLTPDSYAHLSEPYSSYAASTVRFTGEGLAQEAVLTVSQLESRQRDAATLDYSLKSEDGSLTQVRFRGLYLYDLFAQIGIHSNAGDVILRSADGSSVTLPLSLVKGQKFENYCNGEASPLWTMLCFGRGDVALDKEAGTPLTQDGPLYLMVPQQDAQDVNSRNCLANVVEIEVTANDVDTWSHAMSDIFSEFQDYEFTLTVCNDDSQWSHVFTVAQLEKMQQVIHRDNYTVLDMGECEGLDLWKFVKLVTDGQVDLSDPVSVTVYASDGYKNDLLSNFYLEGLEKGVLASDGTRKPILICYAIKGYPLVDDQDHEGYTGIAGNTAGPLRCVAENVQGASVKYLAKLVVTLPGSGPIDITIPQEVLDE